jgi:nicotinate-nucleotide adenylyltransferase
MNIILFGGAFDPPHLGHQAVSRALLNQGIADQVWYVPAKEHPFSKPMNKPKHRLAMLKLIIDDPRLKIEQYELGKEGVSYSRDTLDFLSAKYPQHTFSWVIGSDNLRDFHKWGDSQGRDYLDLLKHYRFYVYPRKDFPFKPLYEQMIPLKNVKEVAISSTEIRQKVKTGQSVTDLINPSVASYIIQQKLYL